MTLKKHVDDDHTPSCTCIFIHKHTQKVNSHRWHSKTISKKSTQPPIALKKHVAKHIHVLTSKVPLLSDPRDTAAPPPRPRAWLLGKHPPPLLCESRLHSVYLYFINKYIRKLVTEQTHSFLSLLSVILLIFGQKPTNV